MKIKAFQEAGSQQKMHWIPLLLYSANIFTWIIIGIIAKQWKLLWLAVLPLSAVVFYHLRVTRHKL